MRRGLRAKMRMRVVHSLHGTRGDARATRVQSDTSELQSDECTHEYARVRTREASSARQVSSGLTLALAHAHPDATARLFDLHQSNHLIQWNVASAVRSRGIRVKRSEL